MSPARARAIGLVLLGALAASGLVAPDGLRAQPVRGETPLEDLLQITVLDRALVARAARGGSGPRVDLRLGETVLEQHVRGRVGVALTDRRVLAVGTGSAAWQDVTYRAREQLAGAPELGDRVALVVTSLRILGFDGGSGNLVERRLGSRERVEGQALGANVAVVVTDRRALGLSPFAGGFFEAPLSLYEHLEAIEASGNFATVRTSRRLLTFRAPDGVWTEQRRGLGH
jgi:hypothetical protein